jgi:hypothetical protein
VKARELERRKAIAEGKMDDPAVPKRLEDAISVVGTGENERIIFLNGKPYVTLCFLWLLFFGEKLR